MANTWSEIYLKWVGRGYDRSYAAHKADLWEKRKIREAKKFIGAESIGVKEEDFEVYYPEEGDEI